MQPITLTVYVRIELSTDGGLTGYYWIGKAHTFPHLPPIGYEIDYRHRSLDTVILDRVLQNPENPGQYAAYQNAWVAMTMGELCLWENAGWTKFDMRDEDKHERTGKKKQPGK